jgi:hypothetical protein
MMEKTCMIAMLDILGFKNTIEENADFLPAVAENNFGLLREALNQAMPPEGSSGNTPSFRELHQQKGPGIVLFSDTLLLYAKGDTDDDVRNFLRTVGEFMFYTIRFAGCRCRGGISYGKMFIDEENSIYIGRPLINAYKLEQEQVWAGVALTWEAEKRIPEDVKSKLPCRNEWWIARYKVPVKKKGRLEKIVIDWTQGLHTEGELDPWWADSEYPTEEDKRRDGDIVLKFENTKRFHREVCRTCNRTGS